MVSLQHQVKVDPFENTFGPALRLVFIYTGIKLEQSWTVFIRKPRGCNRKLGQPWWCFLIAPQDPKCEEKQPHFTSVLTWCLFLWTWEQHRQYAASSRAWPVFVSYATTSQAAEENEPTRRAESSGQGGAGVALSEQCPLSVCACAACPFFPQRGEALRFFPELARVFLFPISLSDPESPLTSLLEQKL